MSDNDRKRQLSFKQLFIYGKISAFQLEGLRSRLDPSLCRDLYISVDSYTQKQTQAFHTYEVGK